MPPIGRVRNGHWRRSTLNEPFIWCMKLCWIRQPGAKISVHWFTGIWTTERNLEFLPEFPTITGGKKEKLHLAGALTEANLLPCWCDAQLTHSSAYSHLISRNLCADSLCCLHNVWIKRNKAVFHCGEKYVCVHTRILFWLFFCMHVYPLRVLDFYISNKTCVLNCGAALHSIDWTHRPVPHLNALVLQSKQTMSIRDATIVPIQLLVLACQPMVENELIFTADNSL